jgi:sugar O-acyltransferase (sialic acid O-acetyltransferase NeuD family)
MRRTPSRILKPQPAPPRARTICDERASLTPAVRRVVLWGATGQAKVLREALDPNTHIIVALFDRDRSLVSPFDGVPLFQGEEGFVLWLASEADPGSVLALVAIGGDRGADRLVLQARLAAAGLEIGTVVHPRAFVARDAEVGAGTQVLAQSAVGAQARLGQACIVNTGATVDHECVLGDGVHVGPGAHLAGCIAVGHCATIGTGAVVLPRVRIGARAVVGAGAVVLRDVPENAVVAGNPARMLPRRRRT